MTAALHSGVLRVAKDLADADAFVAEMAAFRVMFGDTGLPRYGAESGKDDDLIMATALALWQAQRNVKYTARFVSVRM